MLSSRWVAAKGRAENLKTVAEARYTRGYVVSD